MSVCLTSSDFEQYEAGLPDEATAQSFRAHLDECDRCKSAYEEYRRYATLLADTEGMAGDATMSVVPRPKRGGSPAARAAVQFPKIEGYRIVGVLGQGGMGLVYRAVQTKLNRTVALKVLPAIVGTANPAAVARFRREATSAARLHHTNIVPIYDFGESHDAYYYAMELIEGQPLDVVIRRLAVQNASSASAVELVGLLRSSTAETPQLPARTATADATLAVSTSGGSYGVSSGGRGRAYHRHVARWMADAADALHYAHEQSIIHRDIKPANLIISVDDRIMVADFGLAKSTDDASVTMTGSLLGTLRYMSPEQAMAKRMRIDHRTDIYSLGAVMYELLAFQPAFPSNDDKEILGAIISSNPPAPRKINPTVPRELETICLKMLEKSADARYDTARALAEDLRRYIQDLPIVAKRPGLAERAVKFVRRRKAPVIAVTAAVLLVATGVMLVKSMREERRAQLRRLINEGVDSTEEKRWQSAEKALLQALEIDDENVDALLNLAILKKDWFNSMAGRGDTAMLEEADAYCRRALQYDPDNSKAFNTHGVILKKLGHLDDAITLYSRVTELRPEFYAPWVNLGTVYAMKQDLEAAEQHLKRATSLAGTDEPHKSYKVDPWRSLASFQLYRDDPDALESIRKAIQCKRDDVASWVLRARMRLQLEGHVDVEEALRYADYANTTATADEHDDPKAKRMLALTQLRNGRFDRAVRNAGKAIDLNDMPTINQLIIAIAAVRSNDRPTARTYLERALAGWPEDLRDQEAFRATADQGVLWFETGAELLALREEAEALMGSKASPP